MLRLIPSALIWPRSNRARFVLIALVIFLTACTSVAYKPRSATPADGSAVSKSIVIFFDGTRNNEVSDTNVKKLHSLVELQARDDVATLYVEGVGNGEDIIGAITGSGIKTRVEIAYEFLIQNYEAGDRIYLFGFSRGAYAAQMLNSILYHAGIVMQTDLSSRKIAELVFAAVKEDAPEGIESERIVRVRTKLKKFSIKSVEVEMLGLWDTVGALGVNDRINNAIRRINKPYELNIDVQNKRHGIKLCNVRRVFHALSIDDNRELHFTPLLLSRSFAFDACVPKGEESSFQNPLLENKKILPGRLNEVWFAGAHADVGGGYPDSLSSGVSLNWMIEAVNNSFEEDQKLGKYTKEVKSFLPPGAKVSEDIFATHHDPRHSVFKLLYSDQRRNIAGYVLDEKQRAEFAGTICVHDSVPKRRLAIGRKAHENNMVDFREPGDYCFEKKPDSATRPEQIINVRKSQGLCSKSVRVKVFPYCEAKHAWK